MGGSGTQNGSSPDGTLPYSTYPAWSRTTNEVVAHYKVNTKTGLTADQVEEQREQFGYNELEKQPATPLWKLVLQQFEDTLVKILLLAALVSFLLAWFEGDAKEEGIRAFIEPFVILLILILNAVVGVWQESNAEAALDALKDMQSETARVLRDGRQISDLPARELVPGDVIELHTGDKVPADVRVLALRTAIVRAEQASLTGESVPVSKYDNPVDREEGCEIQAKDNMLFAGTAVSYGSCTAIVNDIGMNTEIGKIQAQIQEAADEEEDTPLKKKLNEFGELLAQVIFYICVVVWLINYHNFISWESYPNSWVPNLSTVTFSLAKCTYYFKIAVALAVAAIPEGLPAVITTCLALGTRKMAKKNAIVRKLPSVETLGCTTVICSDKTGTLTTNQMSAVALVAMGSSPGQVREFVVEGHTFNPDEGEVQGLSKLDRNLETIAEVCGVCHDAGIEYKHGVFKAVGNPTEVAMVVLVEKLGVTDVNEQQRIAKERQADPEQAPMGACSYYATKLPTIATLDFDRDRKSMSVICSTMHTSRYATRRAAHTTNTLLVKGAPEGIVERCSHVMLADGKEVPLDAATRGSLQRVIDGMAEKALRCIGLAVKTDLGELSDYDGPSHPGHKLLLKPENYASIESGMTFVGIVGLEDPPRPEVKQAIQECKAAGIRVVVITGDNKLTAEAICRKINVFEDGEDITGKSITGVEYSALSAKEQAAVLGSTGGRCFSRAEPRHKQNIVRLLKEQGQVVAMTGDGVNDAPALKLADIGVAMGITGTEVAKEAADMVLADDNFSTIVAAVQEGRAIYNNMKAFIRYMISSNIGEVASIFITAALGLPEGLIPVQLLWVNLVTDGPPATALGFNPPDPDIMQKPPRSSNEQLITPWILFRWMLVGAYVGFATVGAFVAWYLYDSFLGIDLSGDGHSTVTFKQLMNWSQCHAWEGFQASPYTAGDRLISFDDPCDYFTTGKIKASTLSLSVLVAIEMFNAMNALSEDNSLVSMPPYKNPWLIVAMMVSLGLHAVILYVPFLADIFSIVPLSANELFLVLLFSLPVILIDEVLKFIGRNFVNLKTQAALDAKKKTE